jgi:3D (Asp-Asp-Asp) domain-containing protein
LNTSVSTRRLVAALWLLCWLNCTLAQEDDIGKIVRLRTTAYTHSEGDHVEFGKLSASGKSLRFGSVRSVAADWSVFPLGTCFDIEGEDGVYVVDDYGSALVGTRTLDLYRPSRTSMDEWGVRLVNARVVRWGSFERSLAALEGRVNKGAHIRQMVEKLRKLCGVGKTVAVVSKTKSTG